jgi:tRNA threonylcarbamoyladenosine dehydratase
MNTSLEIVSLYPHARMPGNRFFRAGVLRAGFASRDLTYPHRVGTLFPMPINPMFQRLALVTGEGPLSALQSSRAFVFGLGGVGSWCAEALARSGAGSLVLVDSDIVCVTNVNRQLEARLGNVGKSKALELRERILSVNPLCDVTAMQAVYSRENAARFDIHAGDYVIDAIDSVTFKLDLIEHATAAGATLFSAMGAAAKLDPTALKVADIWDTQGCPLAKLVRKGLRARGFSGHFKAVYSQENLLPKADIAVSGDESKEGCSSKKVINGSAVHVTATAGMILAGLVVQDACARAKNPGSGIIPS